MFIFVGRLRPFFVWKKIVCDDYLSEKYEKVIREEVIDNIGLCGSDKQNAY